MKQPSLFGDEPPERDGAYRRKPRADRVTPVVEKLEAHAAKDTATPWEPPATVSFEGLPTNPLDGCSPAVPGDTRPYGVAGLVPDPAEVNALALDIGNACGHEMLRLRELIHRAIGEINAGRFMTARAILQGVDDDREEND